MPVNKDSGLLVCEVHSRLTAAGFQEFRSPKDESCYWTQGGTVIPEEKETQQSFESLYKLVCQRCTIPPQAAGTELKSLSTSVLPTRCLFYLWSRVCATLTSAPLHKRQRGSEQALLPNSTGQQGLNDTSQNKGEERGGEGRSGEERGVQWSAPDTLSLCQTIACHADLLLPRPVTLINTLPRRLIHTPGHAKQSVFIRQEHSQVGVSNHACMHTHTHRV